jgi:hypothetical protein
MSIDFYPTMDYSPFHLLRRKGWTGAQSEKWIRFSDKLRDQKCVSILEVRPDGFVKDARE